MGLGVGELKLGGSTAGGSCFEGDDGKKEGGSSGERGGRDK